MKNATQIIKELPPDLQQEVLDFAEFLLARTRPAKRKRLRMKWAGALREYKHKYTALELQKKALEWWGD